MSLRNLLPLSRSFAPTVDRSGRYRRAESGVVPDFSVSAGDGGGVARLGGSIEVGSAVRVAGAAHEAEGVAVARWTGPLADRGVLGRGRPVSSARVRRLPAWLEQFLSALIRPGNRRRGTREIQTELSFDRVRVARNDLSTSDVEVVLVRTPRAAESLSAACRTRLLRLWWDQGANRLRRLGQRFR